MKKRSLTVVVAFFALLSAVVMTVAKKQQEPETKTTTTEVHEVQKTKRPRTNKPSQEIITVEYSTRGFLKEGK